jgi:hypothetical protein
VAAPADTTDREALRYARRARIESLALLALTIVVCLAVGFAQAGPASVRLKRGTGRIVPIPASIPHQAGDMVDNRIVPDLRWIAKRFPIYITDGYSGPLPNGGHAGCYNCHTRGSDHYVGDAVDIVPLGGGTRCDASWRPITRLARWAEPTQNHPVAPFRWVGYNGDAGHGCGNHLHLSWDHAPARSYTLADWVETFPVGASSNRPSKKAKRPPPKSSGTRAKPKQPGPTGGYGASTTGGISPGRD